MIKGNYPWTSAAVLAAGLMLVACDPGPGDEEEPFDEPGAEVADERGFGPDEADDIGIDDGADPFADPYTQNNRFDAEMDNETNAQTMPRVDAAVAVLMPTEGNDVSGTVHFNVTAGRGVQVQTEVTGLPEGVHAYHVHKFGDCSAPDASSAGPHFAFRAGVREAAEGVMDMNDMQGMEGMDNMEGETAEGMQDTTAGQTGQGMDDGTAPAGGAQSPDAGPGGPNAMMQPNAILGNLGELTADANGSASAVESVPTASLNGARTIIGRSVVVHAKGNDPSQPPDGAAGARIACGVIGVAQGNGAMQNEDAAPMGDAQPTDEAMPEEGADPTP